MAERLLFSLLISLAPFVSGMDLETIEGTRLTGTRLTITGGQAELDDQALVLDEVVSGRWSAADDTPVPAEGEFVFVLRNGDRIIGTLTSVEGEKLTVASRALGTVTLQLRRLAALGVAREPGPVPVAGKDTIVFANGDALSGSVVSLAANGVVFESVAGKMHHEFKALQSLGLAPLGGPAAVPASAYFRLYLTTGESVAAAGLEPADGRVTLQTVLLGPLTADPERLSRLEVINGRLVYLSALEAAVEEKPFWDGGFIWKYGIDRSIDGNPLTLKKRVYAHGLGVHSYCRLTYDLQGGYESFASDFGIDDEIAKYADVDMQVIGDGKVLFERQGVKTGDDPVQVKLDIQGVRKLELVVDFGQNFGIGDHADWAGARLIRKKAQ